MLQQQAKDPGLNVGDALNLAILEEMVRDPRTTIHAEDLQAGSSYDIPRQTQQTFGELRAADEIIDEGHFIGKAIGEGMNGYRPIVELMNANFGIYGMAELSSAGNTYATTGGQFKMPLTVVGAGGTAPVPPPAQSKSLPPSPRRLRAHADTPDAAGAPPLASGPLAGVAAAARLDDLLNRHRNRRPQPRSASSSPRKA